MKTKMSVIKRFLTVCLTATLVFAIALPVGAASGHSCKYKSVTARPGESASRLKKKVGAKRKSNPSCAASGYGYVYNGKDIKLETYTKVKRSNATEYINSITFKTKKPQTDKGVKIGSTLSKVKKAYSKADNNKEINSGRTNTFTKGKVVLKITIKKNKVTGIKYLLAN